MNKSIGIPTKGYSMIIVFNDEDTFRQSLKENSHLKPLMGVEAYEKENFPEIFIAGMARVDNVEQSQTAK